VNRVRFGNVSPVARMSRQFIQKLRGVAKRILLPLLRPRRFDCCCCGLSKTGTHSMAGIFENYRCEHHPNAAIRLELAMAHLKGEADRVRTRKILRRQDRLLWLEMESSALAGILIEPMLEACPEKKFILTLRDVYSWCDSWLDHNINSPPRESSPFAKLDRVRLRVDEYAPTEHDAPLVERGLAPLACYFQLWQSHNAQILDAVPQNKLLIVKTPEIIQKIPQIAEWVGVPVHTLKPERGWEFAASKKNKMLSSLDPSYVRDTGQRLCGTLMDQYFPDAFPGR
jgi:hypothetical protein